MDEHLEEIIKLAWKTSPSETEYFVSKYITRIQTRIGEVRKSIDCYNVENDEDGIQYGKLISLEEHLEVKTNQFKFLLSWLRGS